MTRNYKQHLEWYLEYAVNRKRKPVKPSTVTTWRGCASKWLIPMLGDLPCEEINNKSVRGVVEKLSTSGLSAQTISNYIALIKLSLAAATNDEGNELYPRKWNHAFLDMPIVKNHRQPTFNAETVSAIVAKAKGKMKLLMVIMAATGMRAGEVLGLEVGHVSADARTLTIKQSCWEGEIQTPKSHNAYRKVDLCTEVAVMLGEYLGPINGGFVFQSKSGTPLHQCNLLRRHLHPILEEIGAGKCGFHAFRRFRATHLRKCQVQESLVRFWLGHSGTSITDVYDKTSLDDAFRQEQAEKAGTGFTL